ncbi:MAG TPA: hypothetical protein VGX76_06765 [Pirellulales bacterium]|nr:hypothetical protein [Pirellulales bacterium]
MGIWNFLVRRRKARLVRRVASQVAERSHAAVMDRVRRRANSMRVAEARRYVRSRALEIVHREMSALHGRASFDTATQTAIIANATEAVMTRVLTELRTDAKAVSTTAKRTAGRRDAA